MSKSHFQIDFSKSKKEEDLIKLRLRNNDVFQVNFSKLVSQSKYVRDKYKYSEAIELIQGEIEEIKENMKIQEESIKLFIELIQEEKVELSIEHYKDIYTLSEYFCTSKITEELNYISGECLFSDLTFAIQIVQDYERLNNRFDTKLTIKIEKFLRTHINECLSNDKFGELGISTIYRLLDESKEKVDFNLLIDFIVEKANSRFTMFKLIKIDKLKESKFYELIKFLESQEETTQQMYLEYIPLNLSLIRNMMNKYEQLLKEKNETKQLLNQIKQELDQTTIKENQAKQEINQTKQELNQTIQELNQINHEFNQIKQELNQTKQKLNQTKQELNQSKQESNQTKLQFIQEKIEENQTKPKLFQCKKELLQAKNTSNQTKNRTKRYTRSIIVGGFDVYNGLGNKPNNEGIGIFNHPIISPPVKLSFDPSSLLSYSVCHNHSVMVMSNGSLKGVGNNEDGRISNTLQKKTIKDFTYFCIKDGSGSQLAAVSAVCYYYGTLYMFSKSSGNERQLVLCDYSINGGDPVFLDTGNHHPVSLFGGYSHLAAIGSEGEVIFINRNSVINSPKSPIEAVSLPDGEKASSVACCDDSIVVLSSNGRVFSSKIESNGVLKFSIVSELSGQEIVCVSGTSSHFLAVSKEGTVFGRGSNEYGQLGLGEGTESVSSLTEISSLSGYEIRAAYAGRNHSLFETRKGKILSCGFNHYGQLLLSSGASQKNAYSPKETTITRGATFCIAGHDISAVFIGSSPPPNTPNTRIQKYE